MNHKFTQSQSTLFTAYKQNNKGHRNSRDEQTILKNPFNQTLPMKFPKNLIRKPTMVHMLSETSQNPERSSVRNFHHSNRSRFFENISAPLTQCQIVSRHPQFLFDTYNDKKLSSPGVFHHLSRESIQRPIRLRTYEDIGVTNNQKREFSRKHYKPDPIIVGQRDIRHNSALEKVWVQPRRHRDNGAQCQKTFIWNPKVSKREPYKQNPVKQNKNASYKEMYLKSKNYK